MADSSGLFACHSAFYIVKQKFHSSGSYNKEHMEGVGPSRVHVFAWLYGKVTLRILHKREGLSKFYHRDYARRMVKMQTFFFFFLKCNCSLQPWTRV